MGRVKKCLFMNDILLGGSEALKPDFMNYSICKSAFIKTFSISSLTLRIFNSGYLHECKQVQDALFDFYIIYKILSSLGL